MKSAMPTDLLWLLDGATKDRQSITSDWEFAGQRLIEGVELLQVRNVPKENGYLVELFRNDWPLPDVTIGQVFQVTLFSGAVSAWHAHEHATDRLFVNQGLLKIVLYDARNGSSTEGLVNEFRLGAIRAALVVIPPKVWHGVQNIGAEPGSIVNMPDRPYRYEDPDHWRVPADTDEIPYRFTGLPHA